MLLYHGSNIEVREPNLLFSRSSLDFGAGFYTTTDIEQAKKWATRVTKLREKGSPLISVFETIEEIWPELSVLKFDKADRDWLNLVVGFRTDQNNAINYDVISGPVANDRTIDVINQYISGAYPEDIALRLLLPMKFKDQWTIKTEKAISALLWKETVAL